MTIIGLRKQTGWEENMWGNKHFAVRTVLTRKGESSFSAIRTEMQELTPLIKQHKLKFNPGNDLNPQ